MALSPTGRSISAFAHRSTSLAETPGTPATDAAVTARQRLLLMLAPPLLVASTYAVFHAGRGLMGTRAAYAVGWLFYWGLWCVAVPLWLVGRQGVAALFNGRERERRPSLIGRVLLAALPLFGFLFVFPAAFPGAELTLLLAFAAYAVVNGVLEEVFWRGLFARLFPGDVVRGFLYPAIVFSVWPLVPLSVHGIWPPLAPVLVASAALGVGLLYGWVAWRTGTVRWTVVSHVLTNLSGLGALIIFAPYF
jgi:membrane protease YdiL (CAAX protease family)